MTTPTRVALLGAAFIAFTTTAARSQGAPRTAEDSVRAAELDRKRALLSADTVLLSRLTGSEFYEVNRLGLIRTRATNMQEISSGALKLQSVNYDSLLVRIYDNVAILTGIADNTANSAACRSPARSDTRASSFDATVAGKQSPCSTRRCSKHKTKTPACLAGASS